MPKKNWLEWAVFGISLALVLFVLGYLTYDAATIGDAPPDLVVTLGPIQKQANAYAIPVTVENTGDATAEDVQLQVVLLRGGVEVDQGEFGVAYVPRHSQGSGWVQLREDPAGGELVAKVLGYGQP